MKKVKILNQARKSIKGVKNILKVWITACQLEEENMVKKQLILIN